MDSFGWIVRPKVEIIILLFSTISKISKKRLPHQLLSIDVNTPVSPPMNSVLTQPWIFSPSDGIETEELSMQLNVEKVISTLLKVHIDSHAQPLLQKQQHLQYLTKFLINPLPSGFTSLDASRPWLLYWCIHSLALFEGELDLTSRLRVASTLQHCQNSDGGFGGGPNQISHLAPSYATISTLCYSGEEGWDMIDRKGMYGFLMSMKRKDGSFIMHVGGEVDVRGCYCALTIATLLNILTPELAANTSTFIASCQTYEGGLASAAHYFEDDRTGAPPLGEAHGGYAFCAVASWAMLKSFRPLEPQKTKSLDVPALLRWATSIQAMPIEGGGFRGRTNKLVDGCYGWWGGGLFGVLGGLLNDASHGAASVDVYDRAALQEYVLLVAQAPGGGLRDKPGKPSDAYHTCYNLSGLSSAQSKLVQSTSKVAKLENTFVSPFLKTSLVEITEDEKIIREVEMILGEGEDDAAAELRMKTLYTQALGWELSGDKLLVGGVENELIPTHPIFNLAIPQLHTMLAYFYKQPTPVFPVSN